MHANSQIKYTLHFSAYEKADRQYRKSNFKKVIYFGKCFEANVPDSEQETKNRESFHHIILMTALNTWLWEHICSLKYLRIFFKAKHTNGQTLHRLNISSALKDLAPSLYHPKAYKFTGSHTPVFPRSTAERVHPACIACHLVNGALMPKLKMCRDMKEHMHFSGLLPESHLFNKYAIRV